MATRSTSTTTALIMLVILSMVPAPRTRPRTSAPEIRWCPADEQPFGGICLTAWYLSSLSPIGRNTTASQFPVPFGLLPVGYENIWASHMLHTGSLNLLSRRFAHEKLHNDSRLLSLPMIQDRQLRRPCISFQDDEFIGFSATLVWVPKSGAHYHVFTTAAVAVGSALLATLWSLAALVLWCKRKKKLAEQRPVLEIQLCPLAPRRYSHRELAVATHGFAEEEKIGQGGFGPVYRGYLADQRRHVAIKVLSRGSSVQGVKEFEAEVRVMTRLRHRNIVQLLGWCDGKKDLLLVYEFVSNGSLDKHLYDSRRLLTWPDRNRIALGLGSAILYLHTGCEQCVVHGDIKPANIMLDASCDARLGDFGLARLLDHGADSHTTEVVAGTIGYIDPELVNNRRPSTESDVYSFGVVLLEIACGRRPTSSTRSSSQASALLLSWVRDMYRRDEILQVADYRLNGEFDERQMRSILVTGLCCAHRDQNMRPSIAQAMDALRREDANLPVDLPVPGPALQSSGSVRTIQEGAHRDLLAEHPVSENSSAGTAYHTSKDSAYLLAHE